MECDRRYSEQGKGRLCLAIWQLGAPGDLAGRSLGGAQGGGDQLRGGMLGRMRRGPVTGGFGSFVREETRRALGRGQRSWEASPAFGRPEHSLW